MHLVGFIMRIYHNARSPENQNGGTNSHEQVRKIQCYGAPWHLSCGPYVQPV